MNELKVYQPEALAFAFALAGNRAALSPAAARRLSPIGRALLDICVDLAPAVRVMGLEATARVWRRTLLPIDRDTLIPNARIYAALLRVARRIDRTTVLELCGTIAPESLLDSPVLRSHGARAA